VGCRAYKAGPFFSAGAGLIFFDSGPDSTDFHMESDSPCTCVLEIWMNPSPTSSAGLAPKRHWATYLNEWSLIRFGISSDNITCLVVEALLYIPWLGVGVHPWSLSSRQKKAALEQAHQRPNECHIQMKLPYFSCSILFSLL
jgi:hypothetical protein